jgi:hypothetical protein
VLIPTQRLEDAAQAAQQVQYYARRWGNEREAPAAAVLTAAEIAVLTAHSGREVRTVRQAVVEIARLVGYEVYRTAPPPGVKRLWLGMRRLEGMVVAWRLQAGSLPESHF